METLSVRGIRWIHKMLVFVNLISPCCQLQQAVEQITELPMIWDSLTPMRRHCHDGVSNHRQPGYLFRQTTKKASKLCITGPIWGESTCDWFISSKSEYMERVSMSWRHNRIFKMAIQYSKIRLQYRPRKVDFLVRDFLCLLPVDFTRNLQGSWALGVILQ